jgi:8-oxo-dGTP pyrophosphatase MutT (NUDIX family)
VSNSDAARPAATVVVLRDRSGSLPEVFMVKRHQGTAFMGGAHVFPGGRVEPADAALAGGAAASPVAAARELFEEAGVLLARDARGAFVSLAGADAHARFREYRAALHDGRTSLPEILAAERLALAIDALVPFAHWVTPPVDVRRFDTRFFVTRVPPEQTPAHDEQETTESVWLTAAGALDRGRQGTIVLPPPTWTTLREIERFGSVDAVLAWAAARPIERREPRLLEQDGVKMLLLPGDPLHPDRPAEPPVAETRFIITDGGWRPAYATA